MGLFIKEEWKPVQGYEGLYEVSNTGLIKSLARTRIDGKNIQERILKPNTYTFYNLVFLYQYGSAKSYYIHRLVALNFIPNPNNKPEVNHINGDKRDNFVENLEWATSKENKLHAMKSGLNTIIGAGETNGFSKLTEKKVLLIRGLYEETDLSQQKIADIFGVDPKTISLIIRKETWRHV